ncbi:MAG: hypothetical protein LBN95_04460 [Prevotellaceae bacterium]|jgi:hypothetical protein|nr:hypothetical protein [Prevotellaceae bacterium]
MKLKDENKNVFCFTTTHVMNENSLIIDVYYDEGGVWQMFSKENPTMDNGLAVCVQCMLDFDKTLYDLPDLKKGQAAMRENATSEWYVEKYRTEIEK